MRLYYLKGILLICLCFSFLKGSAQDGKYTLRSNSGKAKISFQNINNLIVIPVTLNGYPLRFILDTGVGTSIVTEPGICDLAGIKRDEQIKLPVLGTTDSVQASYARNISIAVSALQGENMDLIILEDSDLDLSGHLGTTVHGILGNEIFHDFFIKINYISNIITITRKGRMRIPRKYEQIPLELHNRRFHLNSGLSVNDNSHTELMLLLDLGASHAILLDLAVVDEKILPERNIETSVGRGLGGEIPGYLGRLKSCRIGSFNLDDVIVSFAKDYLKKPYGNAKRKGTIGGDILSRFHLIFDPESPSLWLKPNRKHNRPFHYNMSGMEVIAKGKDYSIFEVIFVQECSPAEEAGIRAGDRIIRINNRSAGTLTLSEIYFLLQSKAGRKLHFTIEREGKTIRIPVILRDVLEDPVRVGRP